jgi:O-antigen/teichoic acid export membrane protein
MTYVHARLISGTGWMLLGGGGAKLIAVATSIVIARMVGQELFGAYGAIFSTVGVFQTVAGFGLGTTATKYLAEFRQRHPERAASILTLSYLISLLAGLLLAFVVFLGAPWIASAVMGAPHLAKALRLSVWLVVLGAVNGVQHGALNGLESFRTLSLLNLITATGTLILAVAGARWGRLEGLVIGVSVASLLGVVVSGMALRRQLQCYGIPSLAGQWRKERAVLLGYSLPSVLATLLVVVAQWVCHVVLIRQPDGFAKAGLFNAAVQWKTAFLFVPMLVGQVAVPIMAAHNGDRTQPDVSQTLRWLTLFNVTLGGVALIGLCLASPWIMAAYGAGFRPGWSAFVVLQLSAFMQMIQSPSVKQWEASGRMWTCFRMTLLWAGTIVVLAFGLASMGALGIAMAQLAGFIVFGIGLLVTKNSHIKEAT